MAKNIFMPALGMSQDDGVIAALLVNTGDHVQAGQVVMEIETDKAIQEIEANEAGIVAEVLYQTGDTVPVGEEIIRFTEANATDKPTTPMAKAIASTASANQNAKQSGRDVPPDQKMPLAPVESVTARNDQISPTTTPSLTNQRRERRILASPKARRLASERGLNLATLQIAEPILSKDLENYSPASPGLNLSTEHYLKMNVLVDGVALRNFIAFLDAESGISLPPGCLLSWIFCRLWNKFHTDNANPYSQTRIYEKRQFHEYTFKNLHCRGLADFWQAECQSLAGAASFIVHDFTRTPIVGITQVNATTNCCMLSSQQKGDLMLHFRSHELSQESMQVMLTELVDSIADPRYLLL